MPVNVPLGGAVVAGVANDMTTSTTVAPSKAACIVAFAPALKVKLENASRDLTNDDDNAILVSQSGSANLVFKVVPGLGKAGPGTFSCTLAQQGTGGSMAWLADTANGVTIGSSVATLSTGTGPQTRNTLAPSGTGPNAYFTMR